MDRSIGRIVDLLFRICLWIIWEILIRQLLRSSKPADWISACLWMKAKQKWYLKLMSQHYFSNYFCNCYSTEEQIFNFLHLIELDSSNKFVPTGRLSFPGSDWILSRLLNNRIIICRDLFTSIHSKSINIFFNTSWNES